MPDQFQQGDHRGSPAVCSFTCDRQPFNYFCLGSSSNLNGTTPNGFQSDFTAIYQPANWSITNNPALTGGSVNTSGAPISISITSGDNGTAEILILPSPTDPLQVITVLTGLTEQLMDRAGIYLNIPSMVELRLTCLVSIRRVVITRAERPPFPSACESDFYASDEKQRMVPVETQTRYSPTFRLPTG